MKHMIFVVIRALESLLWYFDGTSLSRGVGTVSSRDSISYFNYCFKSAAERSLQHCMKLNKTNITPKTREAHGRVTWGKGNHKTGNMIVT